MIRENLKILRGIFFLLILIFSCGTAVGAEHKKPYVNVLTWWGYLDDPEIVSLVDKKCNVNLSYDEYYSNSEFLRRKNTQKYDILIFSNILYSLMRQDINHFKSDLWKEAYGYNPVIRKKYFESKFPGNVVFFTHALTGFLWNPNVISISEKDSIFEIFRKAKNNLVVILDDPVEAEKLINAPFEGNRNLKITVSQKEMLKNFNRMVQNSNVYITNNYSRIYNQPNYAFSFAWSGEAMVEMKKTHGSYNFLVQPQLSYVSADLLAQLTDKPYVTCVAKALTGKRVMTILQNKQYYFSPYADDSQVKDPFFKNIYKAFLLNLSHFQWIESVSPNKFYTLNAAWNWIKFDVNRDKLDAESKLPASKVFV